MAWCPPPLFILTISLSVCVATTTPSPVMSSASMSDVVAVIGQDVHFKCTVDELGNHMVAFIRPSTPPRLLSYDDKIFAPQRHKYELATRSGPMGNQWTLTIKNAQPADRGNYSCQVSSNPPITKTAFLDLRVPPSVLANTESVIEAREGENVTLTCNVDGHPKPTVIWRRQDRQIIRYNGAENFGASVFHGPELAISRVSRRHMSEYICVASNGVPPDESWTIKLLVTFTPHVLAKKKVITVRRGQTTRISCDVEAWPRPSITWQHDGVHVHDGKHYAEDMTVTGPITTVHTLDIRNASDKHYGVYRCTAKNDNGLHHADIEVVESEDDARLANIVRPEGSGEPPHSSPSAPSPQSSIDDDDSDDYDDVIDRFTTVIESTTVSHRHRHHEPVLTGRLQHEERLTTVASYRQPVLGQIGLNKASSFGALSCLLLILPVLF